LSGRGLAAAERDRRSAAAEAAMREAAE
jgi:hypothetical protein